MKKFLSIVLSVAMILGTMSTVVFANATTDTLIVNADMDIDSVNIEAADGPAIEVEAGADVTLTVSGDNYVKGAEGYAGIYVPAGAKLTIVGNGTLTAVGGTGGGAGIGGNGSSASFGTVVVESGTIVATGGEITSFNYGAGAGIGAGGFGIKGNAVTAFEGSVIINGGSITANGGINHQSFLTGGGAAIGTGGVLGDYWDPYPNNVSITISGGTVVAYGGNDAAGIGGGTNVNGGEVTINGDADVKAYGGDEGDGSGWGGAGIGGGDNCDVAKVTIGGNAVVYAEAGGNASAVGAGNTTSANDDYLSRNVIFEDNAVVTLESKKANVYTATGNAQVVLKGAEVIFVDADGNEIGQAKPFAEAVKAASENDILKLVANITVAETVEVDKDLTIIGNGYSIKGADEPNAAWKGKEGVTPIKVNGAELTLKDITIIGGASTSTGTDGGCGGDAVYAENATLNVIDSTLIGGGSTALGMFANGSPIKSVGSVINVEGSELKTAEDTQAMPSPIIDADNASTVSISNSKLVSSDTGSWNYASPYIFSVDDTGAAYSHDNTVSLSGDIYFFGNELGEGLLINPSDDLRIFGNVNASYIANELVVKFVKADVDANNNDTDEEADLYNIVIASSDPTKLINRLNSLDLTFALTSSSENGAVDYEICDTNNKNITINPVNNSKNRYEFHFEDKDAGVADTATEIVIGQVKFTGYGTYSFCVDANAKDTNIVHATKTADSIVDSFIPAGSTLEGEGTLDLGEGITGATIAVPTRTLTINIDFYNTVENNAAVYQDMEVRIVGGTVDKKIALGEDTDADADYTVVEDLPYNTAYTVTVSGAGYRTARYTVNLNDHKTLNFWNNVMDENHAIEVEEGLASSKTTKNFLAGDIVKDNNINIYDLSAVVSYFSMELDTDAYSTYAKYDLNRDGFIDSKDVAYVLVSWGK